MCCVIHVRRMYNNLNYAIYHKRLAQHIQANFRIFNSHKTKNLSNFNLNVNQYKTN